MSTLRNSKFEGECHYVTTFEREWRLTMGTRLQSSAWRGCTMTGTLMRCARRPFELVSSSLSSWPKPNKADRCLRSQCNANYHDARAARRPSGGPSPSTTSGTSTRSRRTRSSRRKPRARTPRLFSGSSVSGELLAVLSAPPQTHSFLIAHAPSVMAWATSFRCRSECSTSKPNPSGEARTAGVSSATRTAPAAHPRWVLDAFRASGVDGGEEEALRSRTSPPFPTSTDDLDPPHHYFCSFCAPFPPSPIPPIFFFFCSRKQSIPPVLSLVFISFFRSSSPLLPTLDLIDTPSPASPFRRLSARVKESVS